MRNPYENDRRMEMISLALAGIIGPIAIFKGYPVMILFCLFLLAFSILSEGLFYLHINKTPEGIKQFIKAGVLVLLITALFFRL
ncbi:hypothetical protein GCM10028778_23510 [Barrientosiimonas marina]|uniref:Phosphatidate cytidylyltransferase n=1 Tax=Lentibacillus kimchii TaxID=1542911 RepID=A0ABW2UVH1_9BACI